MIIDEIKFISDNFESGKEYGNVRKGYRCTKAKSHLIFYKRSTKEIVEIVRILHEKMDIENIIKR